MFNFEASSKPINKNNGNLSTLEDFGKNKKEGFTSSPWRTFGYTTSLNFNTGNTKSKNIDNIINQKLTPLMKQQREWDNDATTIENNYKDIVSDYDKMVILRDQLNENPPFETRTMTVGPSDPNTSVKYVKIVDVPDVDMSYQRVSVEPIVDANNEASGGAEDPVTRSKYDSNDVFKLEITGRTITVTKTAPLNSNGVPDGWSHNLKINIKIEEIPEKKYFHHKDDWEFGDKRKTQREQHMGDAKELLLYTNQFYIIGSITTALTLIFAYKHYG